MGGLLPPHLERALVEEAQGLVQPLPQQPLKGRAVAALGDGGRRARGPLCVRGLGWGYGAVQWGGVGWMRTGVVRGRLTG